LKMVGTVPTEEIPEFHIKTWNDNPIVQIDIGVEVSCMDSDWNLYPHGPTAERIVQNSVKKCTKQAMLDAQTIWEEQNRANTARSQAAQQSNHPDGEANTSSGSDGTVNSEDEDYIQGSCSEEEEEGDHQWTDFADVFGVPDNSDEAALEHEPGVRFEDSEDYQEAVQYALENTASKSTLLRFPYHGTRGKIANAHLIDIQLKVSQIILEDHVVEYPRTKVEIKRGGRAVQGFQIYSSRERSKLARRSQRKLHTEVAGLGALIQIMLEPNSLSSTEGKLKEFKKLLSECSTTLRTYNAYHVSNGGSEVRFEYCFAHTGYPSVEETPTIPWDLVNHIYPFEVLRMAKATSVTKDLKDVYNYAFTPLATLAKMNIEEIKGLSPEIRTSYVHMAEIIQQRVNSTDPGLQGTHRFIHRNNLHTGVGRIRIPWEYRVALDKDARNLTGLPFGLCPKLLPMGPKFDEHFETINGQDKTPSFFLQMAKQRGNNLTEPYVFINAQRKLLMLIMKMCHGIEPGEDSIIPGIMEGRKYSAWIDRDNEAKQFSIKFMSNLFVEVYVREMNHLVYKKLERRNHKAENKNLLQRLLQAEPDGSVYLITSYSELVGLRSNFTGQDVLQLRPGVIQTQGE
jgi:hypothetical protein